jgi:exo-beta-1,3-glucanase (GH17 family)
MGVFFSRNKIIFLIAFLLNIGCNKGQKKDLNIPQIEKEVTAKDILGNPNYQAICYGGYRKNTRDIQPTIEELKEDMKILQAMNIKMLRTYNVHLAHAANVLKAISELKKEDPDFEMYVMLGAWIDCKNAWTGLPPNHNEENLERNTAEIEEAVKLTKQYPDIVKIIAVGNEAMVHWASEYYVQPSIILKWVNHLQQLKEKNELPKTLWITSSDNFASWGGGDSIYHTEDLKKLIRAVDFVSIHTYPMHDTHYNPTFWGVLKEETNLPKNVQADSAMSRAISYAIAQFKSTSNYIKSVDNKKTIHIGETGWASACNEFYGLNGSKATNELKEAIYYKGMRAWTNKNSLSCFYFEAFDEPWKDARNPGGSENHFGLFTVDGNAKYPLWNLVDQGVFNGLTRNGNPITKTFNGNKNKLLENVVLPEIKDEIVVGF